MGREVERKFLVRDAEWRTMISESLSMRQGYLTGSERSSVRVRVCGERAYLNIKGATLGISRTEYEYSIPVADAEELLDTLCELPLIEKIRHTVVYAEHTWEIDEFTGLNAGLVVAEIELGSEGEIFARPPWCGTEVSHDPRYYNVSLVACPYSQWQDP